MESGSEDWRIVWLLQLVEYPLFPMYSASFEVAGCFIPLNF